MSIRASSSSANCGQCTQDKALYYKHVMLTPNVSHRKNYASVFHVCHQLPRTANVANDGPYRPRENANSSGLLVLLYTEVWLVFIDRKAKNGVTLTQICLVVRFLDFRKPAFEYASTYLRPAKKKTQQQRRVTFEMNCQIAAAKSDRLQIYFAANCLGSQSGIWWKTAT